MNAWLFLRFFSSNLQTEQRGVEPRVLLQSDGQTLGEEHQILLQVHEVLFYISFLLFSKTPSTQFQTKFWMDKNLYGSTFRLHWVHWNELGIFLTWSEVGQDFWHVQFQFYEDSCKHLNHQVFVLFVQWKPGDSSHALDEKVIPVVTPAAKICTDSC